MRTSLTLLCLMTFVLGFALIGDALAQPDNPTSAISDAGAALEDGAAAPAEPAAESEPTPEESAPESEPAPEEAAPEAPSPTDQAKGFIAAVKGGHWLLAFGFLSMLIGSILRYLMKMKWKFWDTKAGGYVVAGSMGLATLGAMIVATGSFSVEILWMAILATTAAMGLHGPAQAAKNKVVAKPKEV